MIATKITDDHISESEFLYEFFNNWGRDLGSPKQFYTDNPCYFIEYVENNNKNKLPSFISTQPRESFHNIYGLEKIALDFDYFDKKYKRKIDPDDKAKEILLSKGEDINAGLKEECKEWGVPIPRKLTPENRSDCVNVLMNKRKTACEREVAKFVMWLHNKKYEPMITKTRKGFHVYIYLDMVYRIKNKELIKETYRCLVNKLIKDYEVNKTKLMFLDEQVKKDVYRILRVPTSIHEATGEKICLVKVVPKEEKVNGIKMVSYVFVPEKYRHIDYYRMQGVKEPRLVEAIKEAQIILKNKEDMIKNISEKNANISGNGKSYGHDIRLCFMHALKCGEMPLPMRLAFLMEAHYANKTPQQIMEMLSNLSDFKYDKSKYYVDYFYSRGDFAKYRPWSCKTLQKHNYCLMNSSCPIWDKKYKDGGK